MILSFWEDPPRGENSAVTLRLLRLQLHLTLPGEVRVFNGWAFVGKIGKMVRKGNSNRLSPFYSCYSVSFICLSIPFMLFIPFIPLIPFIPFIPFIHSFPFIQVDRNCEMFVLIFLINHQCIKSPNLFFRCTKSLSPCQDNWMPSCQDDMPWVSATPPKKVDEATHLKWQPLRCEGKEHNIAY